MAGIKVTDLPVLGAAAPDDVMYIVDTSTNTSKQIETGNIFSSGTWTPTISGLINNISVTALSGIYSRVGNVVTASVIVDATFDTLATQGAFEFSLPIASNFAVDSNCIGTVVFGLDLTELFYFDVLADVANNTVSVGLEGNTANANLGKLVINIQYIILP
jgi:hypothetical protein